MPSALPCAKCWVNDHRHPVHRFCALGALPCRAAASSGTGPSAASTAAPQAIPQTRPGGNVSNNNYKPRGLTPGTSRLHLRPTQKRRPPIANRSTSNKTISKVGLMAWRISIWSHPRPMLC